MYRLVPIAMPTWLAVLVATTSCDSGTLTEATYEPNEVSVQPQIIPGQYIVTMDDQRLGKNAKAASEEIIKSHQLDPLHKFQSSVVGFAAKLSDETVRLLRKDSNVLLVEPDGYFHLNPTGDDSQQCSGLAASGTELAPWGTLRVNGGGYSYAGTARAWVIDTGIDVGHPDLNVHAEAGANTIAGANPRDVNDTSGHGTHVAGTIGALKNGIGVVGVAPGVALVPVRVLAGSSGTWSNLIAGIDFVAENASPGDVANISLGGSKTQSVNRAVEKAAQKDIRFSIAAGNSARKASGFSPASAEGANIYTVSSFKTGDVLSSFSNYGNPPVDFAAPGELVCSSYKNGGYESLSGTSMAAPHVAGVLLMTQNNPGTDGRISGDRDRDPDPIVYCTGCDGGNLSL